MGQDSPDTAHSYSALDRRLTVCSHNDKDVEQLPARRLLKENQQMEVVIIRGWPDTVVSGAASDEDSTTISRRMETINWCG